MKKFLTKRDIEAAAEQGVKVIELRWVSERKGIAFKGHHAIRPHEEP